MLKKAQRFSPLNKLADVEIQYKSVSFTVCPEQSHISNKTHSFFTGF